MSQPWERREGETSKAFAAFCTYRDMGPSRSLDAAWRRQNRDKTGTAPAYFSAWSAKYDWVERAAAWDNRVQQKVLEAVEDATVQMEKRLIEAAFNRMLAEVENGMGDWRAALETLKRRKSLEWGDNVSIRADKRAAELIAALLREETAGDNQAA